jgi:hypothetical protein
MYRLYAVNYAKASQVSIFLQIATIFGAPKKNGIRRRRFQFLERG